MPKAYMLATSLDVGDFLEHGAILATMSIHTAICQNHIFVRIATVRQQLELISENTKSLFMRILTGEIFHVEGKVDMM